MNKMNVVKRYLPEKVLYFINKSDFKNKEHLYIICDMIYRIGIYKRQDLDNMKSYTDIPKNYFRDIITDYNSVSNAFNFLLSNKIIECDGEYSFNNKYKKNKAFGYRFNDEYVSKLVQVNIDKKTLSSKIINNKNKRNNLVNDKLKKYKEHYISTFKIDYDKSMEFLNDWYNNSTLLTHSYVGGILDIINKFNSIFISINAINDGEIYFRRNLTNGRVDTNLTSLKTEYRQFIIGRKLYQIDITNSQPFFLSILLNSTLLTHSYVGGILDKTEVERYTKWVCNGVFYEKFEKEYFKSTGNSLSRKDIKDIMFCIFYSKNYSFKKEKDIFKMIFPTIYEYIENEKKNKHNEFAIKLQRIESDMCIDNICQVLDKNDINYYTIHDAWLVEKKDIKKTMNIINKCFIEKYDTQPKLKIEKIN